MQVCLSCQSRGCWNGAANLVMSVIMGTGICLSSVSKTGRKVGLKRYLKLLKWFLFCYMLKIVLLSVKDLFEPLLSYKLCAHSFMYFHSLNSRPYSLQNPEQHDYCNTIIFQTIMNWSTRNNLVWFKSIGETKLYRYSQVPCSVQHWKNSMKSVFIVFIL